MLPYISIGSLVLWSYGLMMGVGFLLGFLAGEADFERRKIPIPMGVFLPVMVVAGLIGAKVDDALVRQWRTLGLNPLAFDWRQIWWGGYTWLGGVLGGLAAAIVLARLWRTPVLKVLDIAPVACLGLACGRMGCFLAGDGDYGLPTTLPWGMRFPHGVVPTQVAVHPTPLYEMACALLLFAALWRLGVPGRYEKLPPGTLLMGYLLGAGASRFAIEFLSRNARLWARLTEAQWVSLGFFLCAGLIRWYQISSGSVDAAAGNSKSDSGAAA